MHGNMTFGKGVAHLTRMPGRRIVGQPFPESIRMRVPGVFVLFLGLAASGCGEARDHWVELKGKRFAVEIADDGPGMAPEVEQHVFEPFFTTKGQKGTGLGLAMVYALVQRAAGRVDLVTAPGQGARFTIWLPGGAPR